MLEQLLIDFYGEDNLSGIQNISATLNGQIVNSGDMIDLFYLGFQDHTLVITATDNAGNTSIQEFNFTMTSDLTTLAALIERSYVEGYLHNDKVYKHIKRQVEKAIAKKQKGDLEGAAKRLLKLKRIS